jgi:choline dehydrogenase-like flavoprotein
MEMTRAEVERMLCAGRNIDGSSVLVAGEALTTQARREVILLDGAIASLLFIQASGISPEG